MKLRFLIMNILLLVFFLCIKFSDIRDITPIEILKFFFEADQEAESSNESKLCGRSLGESGGICRK